jgi:hypothetical protein
MPRSKASDGERQYVRIPVSPDFRDELRVAKARDGLSYEAYLKQHVPVE